MVPFWMVFFTAVVGGLFGGMLFFCWYLVYDASRGCRREKEVVPTRVGMDLAWGPTTPWPVRLSPHAWGWTGMARGGARMTYVVPTRVGMDRSTN